MRINEYGSTAAQTHIGVDGATEDDGNENTPLLGNGAVEPRTKGASFTSSVFNLMNAIMGSGILGLAYAMAHTGIVGFCLLLLMVSSLAAYSIHLLLKLCDQTGLTSYEDIGNLAFQKPGKILVATTILIQNIGAMASYMFILKLELPSSITSLSEGLLGDAWYEDGRMLLIMVTVCIILPLSLLTKIGFLGYTSSLSFTFMVYFTIVVIVKKWSIPCPLPQNVTLTQGTTYQISNCSDSECSPKLFVISSKSAYAIPTMAFSFLCHTTVLPIYCELDRPTKKRMQNVTNLSVFLSSLLYLLSALFGYLTFYANVESQLLQGYDAFIPRDIMVMTVRVAILVSVLLTIPVICFPARKAATLMLCSRSPFSWLFHTLSTLAILGIVLLLAIFVPDIRNVFGVVGSTTSTCLLFVYPGMFYLKLSNQPLRSLESVAAVILLVAGLFVGVLSLSVIIITWVQNL